MYIVQHAPNATQGWECPKCGRVYSPSTMMCVRCPIETVTTTTTNVDFSSSRGIPVGTLCPSCGNERFYIGSAHCPSGFHYNSNV